MPYEPGDVLIRAVMTASTGLPRDVIINDFAFKGPGAPTPVQWVSLTSLVDDFYNTLRISGDAVGEYISTYVTRAATHEFQAWNIVAGPLGSPDFSVPWLGPNIASAGGGLPAEVAAVLSFHADLTGVLEEEGLTRPRARRRGRIYVGPLIVPACEVNVPPFLLDEDLFLPTLRQAAVALFDAANLNGTPWAVWSRVDQMLRPVIAGWTDNAPDTQRRRGPAATARVVWLP